MSNKYLNRAAQLASVFPYDDGLEYYLCAIIVSGGRILSIGYNRRSTNSFVEHFADLARGQRNYCLSTHAEMDAILRVRSKVDLTGSKMYIVRCKPSGGVGMARPCPICENILYRYGIRRAFYTIDDEHYGKLTIKPAGDSSDQIFRV